MTYPSVHISRRTAVTSLALGVAGTAFLASHSAFAATTDPVYVKTEAGDDIYIVSNFGASNAAFRALTYPEWVAAGSPKPGIVKPAFVKYPWQDDIYAVVFFGPNREQWAWHKLTFDDWVRVGQPVPQVAGWIPGSEYTTPTFESNEIYVTLNGVKHHLTLQEWQAAGSPTPTRPAPVASPYYVPDNGHNNYFGGGGQTLGSSLAFSNRTQPGDLVNGTRMQVVAMAMVRQRVISSMPVGTALSLSRLIPQVRAFQTRNGLPATSFIDEATFAAANRALGTNYDWHMDGYIQDTLPRAINGSWQDRVAAMVEYFQIFEGRAPYTWGGAGYVSGANRQVAHGEIGFDCSGLVYQMLAAGGVVLDTVDPVRHALEAFRSTHATYGDKKLKSVPLAQRRNGDIVTFADNFGIIRHNGIFYNGTLLEAAFSPIRRVVWNGGNLRGSQHPMPYVKRPFV